MGRERWERAIEVVVQTFLAASQIDVSSFGSWTRRQDLLAGLEADACFYFGEAAVLTRGKEELNLKTDPGLIWR